MANRTATDAPRRLATLALSTLCAALLAACGGGGGSTGDDGSLSQDTASGYAADATAMPQTTTAGLEDATVVLEAGLASNPVPLGADVHALSASPLATITASAPCAGGGTVTWTAQGTTSALLLNGQLDAGETYSVTYAACVAPDGIQLDGTATLAIAAHDSTTLDLTHSTTQLQLTTAMGRFVLDGSTRAVRQLTSTANGGSEYSTRWTSSGIALTTTFGSRQASYDLQSLDWTIVRDDDDTGALVGRSHSGSLSLAASTPQRPNATLQISTDGSLVIGPDGLAASGTLVVITSHDKLTVTYGASTVTVTLDIGNDGTIDRTWVFTRTGFEGSAG